ncbi:S66 family peptidase [Gynuella sp.]|uniref:S66 family peptidase n=1 Tax=Gynuella sp. TaxID=2969146 RepID=UPI003D0B7C00
MLKPKKLYKGDTLAVLSPSWGGPSLFPHIYQQGVSNLRALGFNVVEFPTATADATALYHDPKLRAKDINDAFADASIDGIITTIGGEDSVRILPYIDTELVRNNPKFFMGYSDATTLTTYFNQLGLVSFNGPAVMAGFSQLNAFSESYRNYLTGFLFDAPEAYEMPVFGEYHTGYPSWSDVTNTGRVKEPEINHGPRFIQGSGVCSGQLFGGCVEVLEMMKGTRFWPNADFWNDKVLFLETSEDKPAVGQVRYWLRNYGMLGVFERISGVLVGRPSGYSEAEKAALEETLTTVISREFGQSNLPVVSRLDFGHTDPQLVMPLGIECQIDCNRRQLRLMESAFSDE